MSINLRYHDLFEDFFFRVHKGDFRRGGAIYIPRQQELPFKYQPKIDWLITEPIPVIIYYPDYVYDPLRDSLGRVTILMQEQLWFDYNSAK